LFKFPSAVETALAKACGAYEISRAEAFFNIVADWLIAHGYLKCPCTEDPEGYCKPMAKATRASLYCPHCGRSYWNPGGPIKPFWKLALPFEEFMRHMEALKPTVKQVRKLLEDMKDDEERKKFILEILPETRGEIREYLLVELKKLDERAYDRVPKTIEELKKEGLLDEP